MTPSPTLSGIVHQCGLAQLLEPDCASALYDGLSNSSASDYLGIQLMGAPKKTDHLYATLLQYQQSSGVPSIVDDNSQGNEIELRVTPESQEFGLVGYKETRTLHADELRVVCNAQSPSCSHAEEERAVDLIEHIVKAMADRQLLFLEKPFWEGVFGTITYTSQNGGTHTVETGTQVLSPLVAGDQWTAVATAHPIEDIERMKLALRDTGMRASKILMNQLTFSTLLQTDQVRESLGNCLCDYTLRGESMGTLMGMELHVYDGFYTDGSGSTVRFIPDGQVVVMGQHGSCSPVLRYDARNIDDRSCETYGRYFQILTADNPRRDAYFVSYYGAPVFARPQAFVSQQVFTL
ncbi:major capsid protein [Candidatus Peribacteria bacterium]|nr:major capsid protein [Candidatus Peribacteria bacterium]